MENGILHNSVEGPEAAKASHRTGTDHPEQVGPATQCGVRVQKDNQLSLIHI